MDSSLSITLERVVFGRSRVVRSYYAFWLRLLGSAKATIIPPNSKIPVNAKNVPI